MADLVHEDGGVDEEELGVLEKSGVLVSRKSKGKAGARLASRPKHIVFLEEGEEGACHAISWRSLSDRAIRYLRRTFEPRSCPRNHP